VGEAVGEVQEGAVRGVDAGTVVVAVARLGLFCHRGLSLIITVVCLEFYTVSCILSLSYNSTEIRLGCPFCMATGLSGD